MQPPGTGRVSLTPLYCALISLTCRPKVDVICVSVFSPVLPKLMGFALVEQVVTSSLGVFSPLGPSKVFEGSRMLGKDLQLTDSISSCRN